MIHLSCLYNLQSLHVLELITLKATQYWKECVTGFGLQSHIPM